MVSAYTLIVQAVQQFNNKSLIEQLSLFGSKDASGNRTQFYAGEALFIRAEVSAGDVYSLNIYGKNVTLMFNQTQKYTSPATNATGWAFIALPLSPQANNQTAYNVVASFAGDNVSTATASMTAPDATNHIICTVACESKS